MDNFLNPPIQHKNYMHKKGIIALSPLMVFVVLYLITSIVAGDFYKVPITVAFMVSSIYAVAILRGYPINSRIDIYSHGAAADNMMIMLWIFILAGAFANSAKVMGSIDATVNLTLALLPANMILAGLFIAACFVSLSVGTSVGTIVALTPIAAGIASQTGASTPLLVAVVVGGSFFGDNLSFISDTTIVATSTQGCRLSDKFRVNCFIAVPSAIIALVIYLAIGGDIAVPPETHDVKLVKVIPYLAVLVLAICGLNVMVVLTIGICLTGIIGIMLGDFDVFGWMGSLGNGIIGMGELIIITMMAGGLLALVRENGGISYIINIITRRVSGKRGAELSIAFLVALVDMCTANNTVAIITVGGIAKQIGDKFGVDNRKCASILDTMSCTVQGIIPYGAQILMASGLAMLNPISIIPYLYYPFILCLLTIFAIVVRYPRRYS